jgi:cell division protein FtsL
METNKRKKRILIICAAVPAVVSVVVHVVVLNTLTIDGKKLSSMQQQALEIEQENQNLQYELSTLGTVSYVRQKAEALGMSGAKVSFVTEKTPGLAHSE